MDFRRPDFPSLLSGLSRALRGEGIEFMLIGGQAVLLHGRPRLTEDIDLTLAAGPDELPRVLDACEELGLQALPEDVEEFVRDTFGLSAADPETRIPVDFIFSTTSYEREAIDRAVTVDLDGIGVPFATAEDLILHGLFADRARDLEDAESVARRQEGALDWSDLEGWAERFSEVPGREDLPERLANLRRGRPAGG